MIYLVDLMKGEKEIMNDTNTLYEIINQITTTNYINKTDLQADIDKYIDILITGLEKLNHQLNNTDIAPGINELRKLRDSIIEIILTDKKILECIYHYVNHYKLYYNHSEGLTDIEEIVFDVVRELLRKLNFKGQNVRTPKGILINYLFKKKFFKKVVCKSYVDSFFERKMEKVKMQEYLTYNTMLEFTISDTSDLSEEEAAFYEDVDNKYYHIEPKTGDEIEKENAAKYELSEDMRCISNFVDDADVFCADGDVRSDFKIDYINDYSIKLSDYKFKYFYDLDLAYEKYEMDFMQKIHKWQQYKDNDDNFIRHISGVFSSKNIDIIHKVKDLDFNNIFHDNRTDKYVKQLILNNLSLREADLIGLTYYKMVGNDKIIEQLNLKDINELNRYRSKALRKLKTAIIKDYVYILHNFSGTYLSYWVTKIFTKYNENMDKNDKNLFTI